MSFYAGRYSRSQKGKERALETLPGPDNALNNRALQPVDGGFKFGHIHDSKYTAPRSKSRTQPRSQPPAQAKRQDYSAQGEGPGGDDGIVLPMTLVGNSAYDAVYTVPILLGTNKQNLSLQVDTGSSDLWAASTSCSTSSCGQAKPALYDSSNSKPTGRDFAITYVEGQVSGPIVWDTVELGNYVIDNQALAAATTVNDEPLSSSFSGILGLALPLNSYISSQLPASTSDVADGAAFSSNLFSITPSTTAPSSRFFSLSLERPGSNTIPSLLGIGRHPEHIVSDPSKIKYAELQSERSGDYFWKAGVSAVTVYVNGQAKPVMLTSASTSAGGSGKSTAVVDSGMPIILAAPDIANGIYGALGIGPANDGQYYVDCTVPINMTITLDNRPEIPLHPLDLTSPTSQSNTCIGIIQAYPAGSSVGTIADIILGVPFMRSAYTVMAYDQPDSNGHFPNASAPTSSSGSISSNYIRPRLGLLGLTDPTTALDEFNTVRVLKQPLGTGGGTNGGAQGKSASNTSGGKKISVGIAVLIGLVGFFALCFALFAARWAFARRRYRRERALAQPGGGDTKKKGGEKDKDGDDLLVAEVAYRLARRSSRSDPYGPSEDTLRALRYSEYQRRKELGSSGVESDYTDDTARTRVGVGEFGAFGGKEEGEFGKMGDFREGGLEGETLHRRHDSDESAEGDVGAVGLGGVLGGTAAGVAGYQAVKTHARSDSESSADMPRRESLPRKSHTTNSIPDEYFPSSQQRGSVHASGLHQRTASGEPSSAAPLLSHTRSDSYIPNHLQMPSPDRTTFEFGQGYAGYSSYSDHKRNSSRMSRMSRMPPPMPLDLPTGDSEPTPSSSSPPPPRPMSKSSRRGSKALSPPQPVEGDLLGSPIPGSGFDLSSRDDVIHSNAGTSGHGQLS